MQLRHIDSRLKPWLNIRFGEYSRVACLSVHVILWFVDLFVNLLQLMEELESEAKEREDEEGENCDSMK